MSNKPKNCIALVAHIPNKAERRHIALVREAKKQGFKNPGSKSLRTLSQIKPTIISRTIREMLKRIV